MKIAVVVGARPEFIKMAPLLKEISARGHEPLVIHTGQHYDRMMSRVFFEELDIPEPKYNLWVGSLPPARQVATAMMSIAAALLVEKPDVVIVFGDTNSTLAGALAANKAGFKLAHVEAGLRSFNREMPEEHNRVVTDHLSDFLFVPTKVAAYNLREECLDMRATLVGDIIMDRLADAVEKAAASDILLRLGIWPRSYFVLTLHRPSNVDDRGRLDDILAQVEALDSPVIFPVHPRLKNLHWPSNTLKIIDPLSYYDMLELARSALMVLTDSGGLQKEAYLLRVPCITLRTETEWIETTFGNGWNTLCKPEDSIVKAVINWRAPIGSNPVIFGKPGVSGRILDVLEEALA